MDIDGSLTVSWNAQDLVNISNNAEDTLARELQDAASNHVLYSTNLEEECSLSVNFLAGFGNRETNDPLSFLP